MLRHLYLWAPVILTIVATAQPAIGNGGKLQAIDKSEYRPQEPKVRGAGYKWEKSGDLHQRSMWGWRLELDDGTGLGFGGIHTWTMQEISGELVRNDDPCVHTQIKRNGEWVYIHEELRKKNPLQPLHDRVIELRHSLKLITGLGRHVYFEGRDEEGEKIFIDERISPKVIELLRQLKTVRAELAQAGNGRDKYYAGQAGIALAYFDRIAPALEGVGKRTTHEKLHALRLARVALEQAAEALDAEPPARVHSMPAYDIKTKLFVIFGGDHFDYLTNDIWVFDPQQLRWQQRHPQTRAPEPRADHTLTSDGQGRIIVRGGYIHARLNPRPEGWDRHAYYYVHAGPGEWVYDLATDSWKGPQEAESAPANTRTYWDGDRMPEHFTLEPRPDAAAHQKVLEALPANTWVDLKPMPKFAGNRDWGTLGYDAERDMIYFYNGGHSAYGGTDVAHYHLATNRWDQPVETEYPLNFIGASGKSVPGWSFNRRPWVTNHLWNSYRYHPKLKRLVVAGRFTSPVFGKEKGNPDVNIYLYDPDLADWEKRVASNVEMSCMSAGVLYVPDLGMIESGKWLLNDEELQWEPLQAKGKLPETGGDFGGFVYDPKRKQVLYFNGGYYDGTPYHGEVFALKLPSREVTSFKPEGAEHIGAVTTRGEPKGKWVLREVVYHPETDMFIFNSSLPGGYIAALDMKKNRWVGLKTPGPYPFGLSAALAYDASRNLIYSVGTRADVSVLRLDPETLEIQPLSKVAKNAMKLPNHVDQRD